MPLTITQRNEMLTYEILKYVQNLHEENQNILWKERKEKKRNRKIFMGRKTQFCLRCQFF